MNYIEYFLIAFMVVGLIYCFIRRDRNWTVQKLTKVLDEYGILYETWGHDGHSNSLENLTTSLNCGEASLELPKDKADRPTLRINVAVVSILYENAGKLQMLREFRYTKQGGQLEERGFTGSVGEKWKTKQESSREAAERGLAEELGETEPRFKDPKQYVLESDGHEVVGPQESDWYPGLLDIYERDHFTLKITEWSELHHLQYICTDNKHTVFFLWMNLHPKHNQRELAVPAAS